MKGDWEPSKAQPSPKPRGKAQPSPKPRRKVVAPKIWIVYADHNTYYDGTETELFFSTYEKAYAVYSDEGLVFDEDGRVTDASDREDWFDYQRRWGGTVSIGELGIDGGRTKWLDERAIGEEE